MSGVRIKICGLSTEDTLRAALDAGADMVGFVVFPKSPRHVTVGRAAELAAQARGQAQSVVLLVDPDDALADDIAMTVRPDLLQLHGGETPERARAIAARTGIGVIKALGVSEPADLARMAPYAGLRLLLDAKPPKDAAYPGGHGRVFDWAVLDGLPHPRGFMLSGGLTPANAAEAAARIRPWALDVSSGVERAPGVKDAGLIGAFIDAVRAA